MSEATEKAAEPVDHALTLATLTEEAERITAALEWDDILCVAEHETLTLDGEALVKAMVPLIRERAEAAHRLAFSEQTDPHTDYSIPQDVADDLLSGLLALWSLESKWSLESPDGTDVDWPTEAVAIRSARLSIRRAATQARQYWNRRSEGVAHV